MCFEVLLWYKDHSSASGELITLFYVVWDPVLLGEHSNGVRFLEA